MKFYYDTATDQYNEADENYIPLKTEEERTEAECRAWQEQEREEAKLQVKSDEVRDFIYSRYSATDQENLKAKILYEREILEKVKDSTKKEGKAMFEWIESVVLDFRKNGTKIDLSKYK